MWWIVGIITLLIIALGEGYPLRLWEEDHSDNSFNNSVDPRGILQRGERNEQ